MDDDGFTPFLRGMGVLAGTIEPFESALVDSLDRMAGVTVSGSKILSLCAKAGETAMALAQEGQLSVTRQLRPGEKLYVEIDGGMEALSGRISEVV